MIPLRTALQITGCWDMPEDVVLLLVKQARMISSVRKIVETYDIDRTMVTKIQPWFLSGEYNGMSFEIDTLWYGP